MVTNSKYQTLGDMMKQEKFEEAPLADEGREGYMDVILDDLGSDSIHLRCKKDITKIVVQTQLTRRHVLTTVLRP